MIHKTVTAALLLAFSISLAAANDETTIYDARVARQKAEIAAAIERQKAEREEAYRAAQQKAREAARDKMLDALSKSIPNPPPKKEK